MADRARILRAAIGVTAVLGLLLGWHTFWFLTDDAFIAFRYISNSLAGHGWVWNAPPFRPVDGYTSLGWIVLLEGIWRTTGIDPPRAANFVALAFSLGQLAIVLHMAWHLPLRPQTERIRPLLVVLVLAGILGNRTFLAWTSSGLETAMFDFVILLWVHVAVWRRRSSSRWLVELIAVAVLAALTRPDGLLYVAATVAAFVLAIGSLERRARPRAWAAAAAGTIAIAGYIGWHFATYGALFPNTFYAKVARYWPSAGWRYLASFVLEYALWWWLGAVLWLAIVTARRAFAQRRRPRWRELVRAAERALPAATIVAHVGYYTVVVGGDHFEYRIYAPLVPLLFVTMPWVLDRLELSPRRNAWVLAAFVAWSFVIPWTHWASTHTLSTRRSTASLYHPVAPDLPAVLAWYARPFDTLQRWLIHRMICVRHQEHRIFYEHKIATLPAREIGELITADGLPVHTAGEAGYVAWVLPNVAIVDSFGLNDYHVARNVETTKMLMAHSRRPPPGYLEAFAANVYLSDGTWKVKRRKRALRPEDVVAIERRFDVWLTNLR